MKCQGVHFIIAGEIFYMNFSYKLYDNRIKVNVVARMMGVVNYGINFKKRRVHLIFLCYYIKYQQWYAHKFIFFREMPDD